MCLILACCAICCGQIRIKIRKDGDRTKEEYLLPLDQTTFRSFARSTISTWSAAPIKWSSKVTNSSQNVNWSPSSRLPTTAESSTTRVPWWVSTKTWSVPSKSWSQPSRRSHKWATLAPTLLHVWNPQNTEGWCKKITFIFVLLLKNDRCGLFVLLLV